MTPSTIMEVRYPPGPSTKCPTTKGPAKPAPAEMRNHFCNQALSDTDKKHPSGASQVLERLRVITFVHKFSAEVAGAGRSLSGAPSQLQHLVTCTWKHDALTNNAMRLGRELRETLPPVEFSLTTPSGQAAAFWTRATVFKQSIGWQGSVTSRNAGT